MLFMLLMLLMLFIYFTDKAIIIEPQDFLDITTTLCAGKDKLLDLEEGDKDVSFEKGL